MRKQRGETIGSSEIEDPIFMLLIIVNLKFLS